VPDLTSLSIWRTNRPLMAEPERREVILRGSGNHYIVVDVATERPLSGPVKLSVALQMAKSVGARAVWQENLDDRGRPLGPPIRISLS
jgi:hypothetical protein